MAIVHEYALAPCSLRIPLSINKLRATRYCKHSKHTTQQSASAVLAWISYV